MDRIPGAVSTASGCRGGARKAPPCAEVSSASTEHTQVAWVVQDPTKVGYERLLEQYRPNHDPALNDCQKNPMRCRCYATGCARYVRLDALWGKLGKQAAPPWIRLQLPRLPCIRAWASRARADHRLLMYASTSRICRSVSVEPNAGMSLSYPGGP